MNFKFKVTMGASERKDKLDKMRGLGGETGESMQELVAEEWGEVASKKLIIDKI